MVSAFFLLVKLTRIAELQCAYSKTVSYPAEKCFCLYESSGESCIALSLMNRFHDIIEVYISHTDMHIINIE